MTYMYLAPKSVQLSVIVIRVARRSEKAQQPSIVVCFAWSLPACAVLPSDNYFISKRSHLNG